MSNLLKGLKVESNEKFIARMETIPARVLYKEWVEINQKINAGELHETAADNVLQNMIVAYREENNLYEDGKAVEDSIVMEMMFENLTNNESVL